jgi:hypothetical protein
MQLVAVITLFGGLYLLQQNLSALEHMPNA